jgi:hypothetical protein
MPITTLRHGRLLLRQQVRFETKSIHDLNSCNYSHLHI